MSHQLRHVCRIGLIALLASCGPDHDDIWPDTGVASDASIGARDAAVTSPPDKSDTTAAYRVRLIGYSTERRRIEAHLFGSGSKRLVFVGGIHGGYEWNTVLLAYQAIDYFRARPTAVPKAITLVIIPVANPDGLAAVVGHDGRFTASEITGDTKKGRLNARDVDLNRNWDCEWQPTAMWGTTPVSAGTAAFSEAETKLLKTYLTATPTKAVIFWHSAAVGVYPGACAGEDFEPSQRLGQLYAQPSKYPFKNDFTLYSVTGDASDYLARRAIASVTVELRTHDEIEWPYNLAAMKAVFSF